MMIAVDDLELLVGQGILLVAGQRRSRACAWRAILLEMSPSPSDIADMRRAVVPVFAVAQDGEFTILGTSFVIAILNPSVAIVLTAAHVLDAALKRDPFLRNRLRPPLPPGLGFQEVPSTLRSVRVRVLLQDGDQVSHADIMRAWWNEAADVAVAIVRLDNESMAFSVKLALDTSPVAVGTRVVAVGYPDSDCAMEKQEFERQEFAIRMRVNMHWPSGEVVALLPEGTASRPGPGFSCSCAFPPGMSGGPVLDVSNPANPRVRGVVSSDMTTTPTGDEGDVPPSPTARAAMIWPITAQQMLLADAGLAVEMNGELLEAPQLAEFIRRGIVEDLGRAHERVSREGDTLAWK